MNKTILKISKKKGFKMVLLIYLLICNLQGNNCETPVSLFGYLVLTHVSPALKTL